MSLSIGRIVVNDTTDKIITGRIEYDRDEGGVLIIPCGTLLPTSPEAGEMFFKTDEKVLYRRNDLNTTWEPIKASPISHKTSHYENGSDEIVHDSLAGTGVFSHSQIDSHINNTNNPHAVTLAQIGAASNSDLQNHINSTNNPHAVTPELINAINVNQKGVANGVATLDIGGKIPAIQLPAAALPEVHVVADSTARQALSVQEGDEAVQLDTGRHWIYDGSTWYERPIPDAPVFGTQVNMARNDVPGTTTSNVFSDVLTLNVNSLPVGIYYIQWYISIYTTVANKVFAIKILNDIDQISYLENRYSQADFKNPFSGFEYLSINNGSISLKIQIATISPSTTLGYNDAKLIFWRIS